MGYRATTLAAVTVLGCSSPAGPPPGVSVTAVLSASAVGVGEALTVQVTITNASANEYLVPGSAGRCIGFVDVRDSRGHSVLYGNPRICDAAAAVHPLAPFGALSDRLPIAGLAAGHYHVRAGIGLREHGQIWSAFQGLSVRAP